MSLVASKSRTYSGLDCGAFMTIFFDAALSKIEYSLQDHFSRLREERGERPIFLIEHGCETDDLLEIQSLVGKRIRQAGVTLRDWQDLRLTLAVAITEVGYVYRGTGTDFWPKVNDFLNTDIQISDRPEISSIFRSLNKDFGFSAPQSTDWARAYNHIAWPIRNALAPIEIHRPLANALRQVLASGVSFRDDDILLSALRGIAAGWSSNRLEDWLQDRELALTLVRYFLSRDTYESWLEPGIINRVANDLRADPLARRLLTTVRQAARREKALSLTIPSPSNFLLSIVEGKATRLLLRGPEMSESDRNDICRNLGGGCDIVPRTTTGRAIPLENFLDGGMIDLAMPKSELPEQVLAVLTNTSEDKDISGIAKAIQPERFFFFEYSGSDGISAAVSASIPLRSLQPLIQLIWSDDDELVEFPLIDCWNGVKAVFLDPAREGVLKYLKRQGFTVSDVEPFEFGGGIALSVKVGVISAISGLPFWFCARRALNISVRSEMDQILSSKNLRQDDILPINLAPGEYVIEVTCGGSTWDFAVNINDPHENSPFNIESEPKMLDFDEFLAGNMSVVINSPLPLENLPFVIQLVQNGGIVEEEKSTVALAPVRIAGHSEIFRSLRKRALQDKNQSEGPFWLKIIVPGFCSKEWPLVRKVRVYEYISKKKTWVVEKGPEIRHHRVASPNSLLPKDSDISDLSEPAQLRLIMPAVEGDDGLSCGIILAPAEYRIGQIDITPLSTLFRSSGMQPNGYGTLEVCEAYIAWLKASTPDLVADSMRKTVATSLEKGLVQQICGRTWAETEEKGDGLMGNAYDALVSICFQRNLVAGPDFPDLAPEDYPAMASILKELLVRLIPDIDVASESEDEAAFEALDFMVNDAYEELSKDRQARGKEPFEEQDAGTDPERWRKALRDALKKAEKPGLRPLILPENRWLRLSQLDYSVITQDGIVDALFFCHLDISRRSGALWLSRRELRSGLQLWLSPGDLLHISGWRDHIGKLLSDRQTARAIRYSALRFRAELNNLTGLGHAG